MSVNWAPDALVDNLNVWRGINGRLTYVCSLLHFRKKTAVCTKGPQSLSSFRALSDYDPARLVSFLLCVLVAFRYFLQLAGFVWMRIFVSGDRLDNFIVGLTDVSPAVTAPTLWNYDLCSRYPGAVPDAWWFSLKLPCVPGLPRRRYLIVQTEVASGSLNFCEIGVTSHSKLVFVLYFCSRIYQI